MTPDAADLPDFDNGRTRQPRFGIMHRKRGLLLLAVFLQQLEHTGPASAVVFARDRLLAQTAVRDLHVCAGAGARELPAYETAALRLIVPVGDPGIRQNARRIEFNNLSMSFEFAHAIDFELAGGIGGLEAPLAADARPFQKRKPCRRRCSTTAFAGRRRSRRETRAQAARRYEFH